MIRIATVEQTRAIEQAADASGFTYAQMMEQAGRAAANRALAITETIAEPRVTVLVGPGNNGGDGLVAGLFVAQDRSDAEVRFYLLKDRSDEHIQAVREAGLFVANADDDSDKRLLRNLIASSDLVLDALFGIGLRLPIRDAAQTVLQQASAAINEHRHARPDTLTINPARTGQVPRPPRLYMLAIDCPSGLDCDSGEVDQHTIAADETITFITAKTGQLSFPGARIVGELSVANIGISEGLSELQAVTDMLVDSDMVRQKLPPRTLESHKGTYGRALIVAGSVNYIGAPILAAESAYRAGAGLVTVGTASSVVHALSGTLREPTWLLLPQDLGVIAEGAVPVLAKEMSKFSALLVGPGLGTEKTTRDFLTALLQQEEDASVPKSRRHIGFQADTDEEADEGEDNSPMALPPLVIDADGLNLLSEIDNWWTLLPDNTILTPHPGEMARLAKIETAEVQTNRWSLAREKAAEWKVMLLLKGAHTVIAGPDGRFAVLPFKTDALATAGTGDVLAGAIVGLLAQGAEPFEAALAGGYIHGLAGQIAAENGSSRSVTAGDVANGLGDAFRRIEHRH